MLDSELALREQLSSMRGLLALSLLMTERRREDEILHLARTATPALVDCEVVGVHLDRDGWHGQAPGPDVASTVRVARQLGLLPSDGGPLDVPGWPWAWGVPLPGVDERVGHLLVASREAPPPAKVRLLRSLAQQTGIAVSNARLHASHLAANAALADTVALLERKNAIHDRFTQVALNLDGYAGIVRTLFELTGLPAVVEDDRGNVLGRSGPELAPPTRELSPAAPSDLARRALRAGRPIHAEDRLLTVARPRPDLVGLVYLIGPESLMGEQETMALEYAATVLAIELARLHSIAETELRLGVDLVSDLVSGAGDGVAARARALGHDLGVPHRVVALRGHRSEDLTDLLPAAREALAGPRGTLLMHRANTLVAVVATGPADGTALGPLSRPLLALATAQRLHVGVGGLARVPGDYPRSHREALMSLRLAEFGDGRDGVVTYDELGVFQFLSEVTDPRGVDAFVRRWLGSLLDYDERRGSELVLTLARFLDTGGGFDAAARALGIGRSTVRYRMARIAELTGLSLSDPDTRFQLQLATRSWLALRALAAEEPSAGS
ncbi:MAG: helix-turn-helix domain-containing protein [Nocardioidaceae bacterium]